MSLENEKQMSADEACNKFDAVSEKPRISYDREFLLSLSNLDISKKLPSDFDKSLLSEFEDALQSIQDRPRVPGSLPFQAFRRNEHGSSPPARGDSGNYSRGIYGKWESRSSGQSERESDSQSDRGSDNGSRYGLQSRRSWETSEKDGLLGSGSFPRSSGLATGVSAPRARANEPYQLRKTNEPYHPPRPYKAVPYSRRDTDAFNDETFGSLEGNDEDREEEEKRRRASFEMMRKEQQRALQEKPKLNNRSSKIDIFELLEGRNEEKRPSLQNHELEVSAAAPNMSNDLEKASKPLVPPGFRNTIQEKIPELKSRLHNPLLEEQKPVSKERFLDAEVNLVQNDASYGSEQRLSQENRFRHVPDSTSVLDREDNVSLGINLDVPIGKPGMENQLSHSSHPLASHGTLDAPEIARLSADILGNNTEGDTTGSFSTSILGKIFGSTLSIDDNDSSSAEHHDDKAGDAWRPSSVRSSKFAQWFLEEEAKPTEDFSPAKPNDLLSLIGTGDKGRSQVADSEKAEHIPHDFAHNFIEKSNVVSDQTHLNNKETALPAVLTCEDLEQSILTDYTAKTTNIQPSLDGWSAPDASSKHVEDPASLNLLSLLQKGTDQNNTTPKSHLDFNPADKPLVSQAYDTDVAFSEPKHEENTRKGSFTLETLFGSAFMKELKSVDAPVSAQRGSSGSYKVDVPMSHELTSVVADNGINSPAVHENRVWASNERQLRETMMSDNWLHFDDHQLGSTSNRYPTEVPSQFENNINSAGDPQNHPQSSFFPTHNSVNDANFSSNASIDIMNKLAVKDETITLGPENLPFRHGPYGNMQPLPQFQPSHMPQMRPFYNHLESNVARMSPPANQQFPPNMIQHHPLHRPSIGVAGFDIPPHHSTLNQMKIPGNHTQMIPEFPGGGPVSHHGIHEMDHQHGFPFGARQPSFGKSGLPIPGPNIYTGSNPPDSFQRLIDMELRANSKRIHTFPTGHKQGSDREMDLGFQYR